MVRTVTPTLFLVLFWLIAFNTTLDAQDFMMQGWYWNYPKPADPKGNPGTEQTWAKTVKNQVPGLARAGFTYFWAPPMSRASFGSNSNGYDPKDLYDLGAYGLGATGFGFRQDVANLASALSANNMHLVADVIYNHRDGGRAEDNSAVKAYITNYFSGPPKSPFPSDRFRCVLPLGGTSGNGVGDYYFKISSKTGNSAYHNKPYKLYLETGEVGWQNLADTTEVEPNGGDDCGGEPFNAVVLGRNVLANVDALDCAVDEFKLTLGPGDFDPAGDFLYIYLSNLNGDYSDHRIYGVWNASAEQEVADQLKYQTYTDFSALPSGKGGMNWSNFRPSGSSVSSETLAGDWNSMLFFYDYDQSVTSTRNGLFEFSKWLWDSVGVTGYRMDAVKHFDYAFVGDLLDYLHGNRIDPGMVVGEFFDFNAAALNGWVANVESKMDAGTKAAIDVRVFDFALRKALRDACDRFGYDVRNVFNSGMVDQVGADPFSVITFVNNHDLREIGASPDQRPVQNDPMLAYAYLLTNNQVGLPCVFYPDYFGVDLSPDYPVVSLRSQIDLLLQVHQQYIYQSSSIDKLNRFDTPYSNQYDSGFPNTTLLFQLSGGVGGKEVIVCINFAGIDLSLYHQINPANVPPGETFTDVLGRSNGPNQLVLDGSNRLHFQLPARSYSVWVQGAVSPLPVEFLRFQPTTQADYVELEWETANESSLAGFQIERSTDGLSFDSIAWVMPIAREGEGATYLHLDREVDHGYFYYRLKSVNSDGSYSYSDARVAYFREDMKDFELVPNPTKSDSSIVFWSGYNNVIQLQIYDQRGKAVISKQVLVREGENRLPIDLNDQPHGVFFVKIKTPGGTEWTSRVVKF